MRAGGGSLDVRVPLRATLDLLYNAAGGGLPTLGSKFTIGSIPLHQTSFATGMAELGGLYFNMLFKPPEVALPFDSEQFAILGAFRRAVGRRERQSIVRHAHDTGLRGTRAEHVQRHL